MHPGTHQVAPVLWLLFLAFTLRVFGQMLVVFAGVTWLPPNTAWMSGLMPYRFLLPAQLVILALHAKICVDFTRGAGWFVRPRPAVGRGVLVFGYFYFALSLLRCGARFLPATAWLGDWIPTVFHLVLASFVVVFARWHRDHLVALAIVPTGVSVASPGGLANIAVCRTTSMCPAGACRSWPWPRCSSPSASRAPLSTAGSRKLTRGARLSIR